VAGEYGQTKMLKDAKELCTMSNTRFDIVRTFVVIIVFDLLGVELNSNERRAARAFCL